MTDESAQGKKFKYQRPFDPPIPIDDREYRFWPPRWDITCEFARWTAVSALRSGSPIKNRNDIHAVLDVVDFNRLFDKGYGPIYKAEFTDWHRKTIGEMLECEPRLTVGWAAKMIAVYLKTACYLAGFGRNGLSLVIHPPIDTTMIKNLRSQFSWSPDITRGLGRFKSIGGMDSEDYEAIIEACELAADEYGYTLFEMDMHFRLE